MKSLEDINRLSETVVVVDSGSEVLQQTSLNQSKKIINRVWERFENELVGEGPHINHSSHQDHSDTYTP
jgi:hypothetical protein